MAAARPPDHDAPIRLLPTPHGRPITTGWRLPRMHQQDLRDVARGTEESLAGIASTLPQLEDAPRPDHDDTPMLDAERYTEERGGFSWSPWARRMARSRRALAAMRARGENEHASVLHVAYGHPDPSTRAWPEPVLKVLGELAPLARYTDATEDARRRLVRRELTRVGVPTRVGTGGPLEIAVVVELAKARELAAWIDRVTTSGDALAWAMSWEPARRDAFTVAARADADAMLERASRAYHRAWHS